MGFRCLVYGSPTTPLVESVSGLNKHYNGRSTHGPKTYEHEDTVVVFEQSTGLFSLTIFIVPSMIVTGYVWGASYLPIQFYHHHALTTGIFQGPKVFSPMKLRVACSSGGTLLSDNQVRLRAHVLQAIVLGRSRTRSSWRTPLW